MSLDLHAILAYALVTIIVIGATLRLTRFVVTDSLGGWLLRDRAQEWADWHEKARRLAILDVAARVEGVDMTPGAERLMNRSLRALDSDEPLSWQARLVSGLHCPFCVGFWIGLILIAGSLGVIVLGWPPLMAVWFTILSALALNYVTAHISARLD